MKKFVIFSLLFLFLTNCNNNDTIDSVAAECDEVFCTEIFISLSVSVKDASGVSIVLDRFQVLDKETSKDITLELNDTSDGQNNQYPLYSDLFVSGNENTTRTLVFNGFINDELRVEAEFIVDTDCCHVSLTKGNTEITIN